MAESTISQGDFNCRASSQADFILNYFLSNFLKFLHISSNFLSNSPFPPSPAGRLEQVTPPWLRKLIKTRTF